MDLAIKVFWIFIFAFLVFVSGRRWESFSIKTDLEETGRAITRYGDHGRIEITGTVKEI